MKPSVNMEEIRKNAHKKGYATYSQDGKWLLEVSPDAPYSFFTIMNGVEYIAARAFVGNHNIKKVICPQSLRHIGENSFASMKSLEEIKLNEGLESIEANAFIFCKKLKCLVIPDSVVYIGSNILSSSGVGSVWFSNALTVIPESCCSQCHNLKYVRFPEGLKIIRSYAFKSAALSKLELPETVKYIHKHAFENNMALESVECQGRLTAINNCAFFNCTSLRRVSLRYHAQHISAIAFLNCDLLEEVPTAVEQMNVLRRVVLHFKERKVA